MKGEASSIAYYMTAHGYGHGVRSTDLLRAFCRRHPETPVHVISALPEPFLKNRLPDLHSLTIRNASFDVGMVQLDSVRVDVDETLKRVHAVCLDWDRLVKEETAWLQTKHVRLVVSDIPAIPLEAAARAGIPRLAVGNFAWNWIYSCFEERNPLWKEVIDRFAAAYAQTDLLMRLPFAEPMTVFPRQMDLPVVATPGTERCADLSALTGCPLERKWILLSFTTLDWDDAALEQVRALEDYAFFTVKPLEWSGGNIYSVDRNDMLFSDVLASVDAVVTKPGFGILSECVVNRKPIIYVERTDFLEYPILEAALKKYLRHQHIPSADLYAGNLAAALHHIWDQPEPEHTLNAGGDQIAADTIWTWFNS